MSLLLVSQAPLSRLLAYKRRLGWRLPWVSAANSDFNYDFGASYPVEEVRSWGLDEGMRSRPGFAGMTSTCHDEYV